MNPPSQPIVDETELMARYLADQLPASDREQFESRLLSNPQLAKELDHAARFKAGLMDLERSGELCALIAATPWWRRPQSLAFAATLLLVLLLGMLWMTQWRGRTDAYPSALFASIASHAVIEHSYLLERTRASSYDLTLTKSSSAKFIELRLKPQLPETGVYRVELGAKSESNAYGREQTSVVASQDGFIRIYLNVSRLALGVYELKVTHRNGGANSTDFLVEVVAPQ